jgi:hypothetical protein
MGPGAGTAVHKSKVKEGLVGVRESKQVAVYQRRVADVSAIISGFTSG